MFVSHAKGFNASLDVSSVGLGFTMCIERLRYQLNVILKPGEYFLCHLYFSFVCTILVIIFKIKNQNQKFWPEYANKYVYLILPLRKPFIFGSSFIFRFSSNVFFMQPCISTCYVYIQLKLSFFLSIFDSPFYFLFFLFRYFFFALQRFLDL